MRRQDIIAKLMNEGFSQKTLVNLTDKQLTMLSERIISEQIGTTSTTTYSSGGTNTPVLNIPKTDVTAINKAKSQKKTFATYEGEMKENELKRSSKKKTSEEKNIVLKRINHKIETKMKNKECIKSEIELLKRMGETIPEKAQKYYNEKMSKKKEKVSEPVEQTTKPISNIPVVDGSNKKIKTWVNKIVENRFVTSKDDILQLIQNKLMEQRTMESPRPAEPDIKVDPDKKTRPGQDPDDPFRDPFPDIDPNPKARKKGMEMGYQEKPEPITIPAEPDTHPDVNPDDPFRDPFPDIDPNPKAKRGGKEISAQDAKNKIIALLKSEL